MTIGRPKTGAMPARSLRVPDDEWLAWKQKAFLAHKPLSQWLRDLANKEQTAVSYDLVPLANGLFSIKLPDGTREGTLIEPDGVTLERAEQLLDALDSISQSRRLVCDTVS